jgi:hypothetical protein
MHQLLTGHDPAPTPFQVESLRVLNPTHSRDGQGGDAQEICSFSNPL